MRCWAIACPYGDGSAASGALVGCRLAAEARRRERPKAALAGPERCAVAIAGPAVPWPEQTCRGGPVPGQLPAWRVADLSARCRLFCPVGAVVGSGTVAAVTAALRLPELLSLPWRRGSSSEGNDRCRCGNGTIATVAEVPADLVGARLICGLIVVSCRATLLTSRADW